MSVVYVIAGPNGSGKTTVARKLINELKMPFLNADDIAYELNPKDISSVRLQAGKLFLAHRKKLMDQYSSFAFESTLSGSNLKKFLSDLKKKDYHISIAFYFLHSPQECIERIKTRVKKGGHFVPDADVIRRYSRSIINFWSVYKNLADQWKLYYSGRNSPVQLAYGKFSDYEIVDRDLFELFMKVIKNEQ